MLASLVYYKISYIDTPYFEADIRSVLNLASSQQISLDMGAKANTLALEDIRSYIEDNTNDFNKLSFKTILNRYTTKPYGFVELDVSQALPGWQHPLDGQQCNHHPGL